jgi:hypothetical protein
MRWAWDEPPARLDFGYGLRRKGWSRPFLEDRRSGGASPRAMKMPRPGQARRSTHPSQRASFWPRQEPKFSHRSVQFHPPDGLL